MATLRKRRREQARRRDPAGTVAPDRKADKLIAQDPIAKAKKQEQGGDNHGRTKPRQIRRRPANPRPAAGQDRNRSDCPRIACSGCSDALKREIDKGTSPGVNIMVARRGQIGWFESHGRQSPAADTAMDRDSIFRIFSMTKPIVSVGIMMLIEDGELLLMDPVEKFIPEFAEPEGRRRDRRQARTGAADALDHHPGSAAAHLRHHLRPVRRHAGASDVSEGGVARPRHQQCRTRRDHRRPAAAAPAGPDLELQPLHRRRRPRHRSGVRQAARAPSWPSASSGRCR